MGMRLYRTMMFSFVVISGFTTTSTEVLAQSAGNTRINRATRFLDTEKRSKFILSYMHMGGTYQDYEVLGSLDVVDKNTGKPIPGYFAIKVVYNWTTAFGDNSSTALFFFDEMGTLIDITAKTTSIFNQPFDLAGATLNVLGNVLIQAFGDQMKAEDRQELQKLVDSSDAKKVCIWALNFQQRVGN